MIVCIALIRMNIAAVRMIIAAFILNISLGLLSILFYLVLTFLPLEHTNSIEYVLLFIADTFVLPLVLDVFL